MTTRLPIPPPDTLAPGAWPKPVLELCARLEDAGIAAFLQGERVLDAWLGAPLGRAPGCAVVCLSRPEAILQALPFAVVTAESAQRMSQATAAGPVDLIAAGDRGIDAILAAFGLAPLAVAFRPRDGSWHAPHGVLEALAHRVFDPIPGRANPFTGAPRRYWLAAQLIAEYDLEPTPALVAAARDALPEVVARLPEGAPARRVLERILACPHPARALAFLRESGASGAVLPGLEAGAEARVEALAKVASLRWAAFLRGASTARALARLRMPVDLARRIQRVQEAHPVDRTIEGARDPQIRRAMGRLTPEELDGLILWRRLELEGQPTGAGGGERDRLAKIEAGLARLRQQASTVETVRALALGGAEVMRLLGAGPGPHVGRALAHLAHVVAEDPDRNDPATLAAELVAWQASDAAAARPQANRCKP
jgi:tRNA nucleotidyltransferase (CCA-adding enzyme)